MSAARVTDVLALFGPDATLLAESARGDGRHLVIKARATDGASDRYRVVKLYGRKRSLLRDALRDLGQRVLVGKTGMRAARRARVERDVLALWRREGFDVPRLEEDAVLPATIRQPAVVMEFVPGRLLDQVIADSAVPLEEKERLLTRLARDWGRRHARAHELDDPRLIQLHASLDHVIHFVAPERLVTFDFEVAWTRRHPIARLAAWELEREEYSLRRCAPPEQFAALRAALERGYGARPRATKSAAARS